MEKIKEKQQKRDVQSFQRFGESENHNFISGSNNLISFTKKRSHYMFVVDWQLDNDYETLSK